MGKTIEITLEGEKVEIILDEKESFNFNHVKDVSFSQSKKQYILVKLYFENIKFLENFNQLRMLTSQKSVAPGFTDKIDTAKSKAYIYFIGDYKVNMDLQESI